MCGSWTILSAFIFPSKINRIKKGKHRLGNFVKKIIILIIENIEQKQTERKAKAWIYLNFSEEFDFSQKIGFLI